MRPSRRLNALMLFFDCYCKISLSFLPNSHVVPFCTWFRPSLLPQLPWNLPTAKTILFPPFVFPSRGGSFPFRCHTSSYFLLLRFPFCQLAFPSLAWSSPSASVCVSRKLPSTRHAPIRQGAQMFPFYSSLSDLPSPLIPWLFLLLLPELFACVILNLISFLGDV